MSPHASAVLLEEVAPRLKSAVHYIKPVGCEDAEELLQDGILMAAKMLNDLEARGKQVTPGNVAYYCILHLKSGRRSHSANRTDVFSSGTQLDNHSCVLSLETEVGWDVEINEPIRLGEMLSNSQDDPSMMAGRNLDWEQFLSSHDHRYGLVVMDIAEEISALETSRNVGVSYASVRHLREQMSVELREFMGDDAVADAAKIPSWRANLMVDREKALCRADR
jgi:hypothetical protein